MNKKIKFRYYIKLKKPFVFKNNLYFEKVYQLKEDENFYYFYVYNFNNKIYYDDSYTIEVLDLSKGKTKIFLRKYLITLLGLMLFILSLFLLNNNVTEIKFEKEEYYNQEVYEYVYNKLQGDKFKFINKKEINYINSEIRSIFYGYQWVSIKKKGTIIYIDIAKTDDDKIITDDNVPGGLYSKYDAIIKGYAIEKGTSLIKKDCSVNAGDELISGKITLYDNKYEFIHAKGYVIGEVAEYITLNIDKSTNDIVRTGRVFKDREYIFFGNKKNKEYNQFENFDVEYKDKFKIGNIFKIVDVYIYELKEVRNEYSLEDAYDYAKSEIISQFNENKKYQNEKIISLELINGYLKDDVYYVTYLLTSDKDISEFKEYIDIN